MLTQLEMMVRAAQLVLEAIKMLDEAGAPADIGARLDHAYSRLTEVIDATRSSGR